MLSSSVVELIDIAKRLEMTVDGDDIAAVTMVSEWLLAKTMQPLRAGVGDLGPQIESDAVDRSRLGGAVAHQWSGHAIADNVTKRLAERYRADEAAVLGIVGRLDAKDTETSMRRWVNFTEASLDDDPEKPPREDEFFHSEAGPLFLEGLLR